MPAGRPPIYKSAEDMQKDIDVYMDSVKYEISEGVNVFRPTMSGLALHLGMDRKTLLNYSKKDEFFPTVRHARQMVEVALEQNLYGTAVTGTIFNLKNNFGWVDKYENDNTHKIDVIEIQKDFGE